MEKRFPRDVQKLHEVFDFITGFCATTDVPEGTAVQVELIVEELFTNMIKYNLEGQHDISVQLSRQGRTLEIRVTDFDVHDFDITRAPEVDITRPASERAVGGLGIQLVKRVADGISYAYENRNSTITAVKRLED